MGGQCTAWAGSGPKMFKNLSGTRPAKSKTAVRKFVNLLCLTKFETHTFGHDNLNLDNSNSDNLKFLKK